MSHFHSYPKIHSKSKASVSPSHPFCVTEKCHGSNFVFIVEADESIRCAKRKGFLDSEDAFFGFRRVLGRMRDKVLSLARELHQQFGNDKHVYLYGELAGGFFPGKNNDEDGLQPVQTGVWYSDDLIFYAFDLGIQTVEQVGETTEGDESSTLPTLRETHFQFVDYEHAIKLFKDHDILFAEPLFVGPYNKCLEYKLGFHSTLPSKLGMPSLQEPNKAEGVVVKPFREITPASQRPMTKLKIVEFEERSDVYDQSTKTSGNDMSTPLNSVLYEMYPLITSNRYANTLSKTGSINGDREKAQEVLDLFEKDVLEELLEENPTAFDCLMGHEMKLLNAQLRTLCKKCIVRSEREQQKKLKALRRSSVTLTE